MDEPTTSLEEIRDAIDSLDDDILTLLIKRAGYVVEAGKLKQQTPGSKQSIIRPGREAEMIRRIVGKETYQIPKASLAAIWRILISSAVNIEEDPCVAAFSVPNNRECYWLSREYFGAFTPTLQLPTTEEVLLDITKQNATIGVVPLWDTYVDKPWWVRIISQSERPYVFAKLPFIQNAPSKKSPVMAFGYVVPEQTSQDESLWVIKTDGSVSSDLMKRFFDEVGAEASLQGKCSPDSRSQHYTLWELSGFINENSAESREFLTKINSYTKGSEIDAFYLGSYATPLLFS